MWALASFFVVVVVAILVTRVATVVLALTGLSRESARFQARSAVSRVGFATSESEAVVKHPRRRRVVMLLMLLGSAATVTAMAALILSLLDAESEQRGVRLAVLAAGLIVVILLARSRPIDRVLFGAIGWALHRWPHFTARDGALLHLSSQYAVMEVHVEDDDWLARRTLTDAGLRDEGVELLGIEGARGGFVGAPLAETRVEAGDTLIVYGRTPRLCELETRKAGAEGEFAHRRAVVEQRRIAAAEAAADPSTPPA